MTYTVKIADFAGKPVQAETSLAMVDLAVLSLLDRLNLPIADQFYGERGLGIRTGVSLVYSVDRINVKLAEEAKGGGGGAEAAGGLHGARRLPRYCLLESGCHDGCQRPRDGLVCAAR